LAPYPLPEEKIMTDALNHDFALLVEIARSVDRPETPYLVGKLLSEESKQVAQKIIDKDNEEPTVQAYLKLAGK
jgi:hypothetical protein